MEGQSSVQDSTGAAGRSRAELWSVSVPQRQSLTSELHDSTATVAVRPVEEETTTRRTTSVSYLLDSFCNFINSLKIPNGKLRISLKMCSYFRGELYLLVD